MITDSNSDKCESIIGEYGTIYLDDCNNYLYNYDNDQFDLAITDPPWGIEYSTTKIKKHHKRQLKYAKNKKFYDDNKNKIKPNIINNWFSELYRISKCVCLYLSSENYLDVVKAINKPCHTIIYTFPNGHSPTSISRVCCFNPILIYKKPRKRLFSNVIHFTMNWGFLNDLKNLIHPHPKDVRIYETIINETKSESVIDPFVGSGTLCHACEKLKIKYTGFEIDSAYKNDIQYRLNLGIQQRPLHYTNLKSIL